MSCRSLVRRFLQEQVAKSEMLQATQVGPRVEELGWKAVFFGLEGPIYLDVPRISKWLVNAL